MNSVPQAIKERVEAPMREHLTSEHPTTLIEAFERITQDHKRSDTLNYRIANEDRPFRWVFSSTYELPFGKGKAFGSGVGGFTDRVIGGWQMAGIVNLQSGAPVTFQNSIYFGGDLEHPIILRDSVTESQVLEALETAGPSKNAESLSTATGNNSNSIVQ